MKCFYHNDMDGRCAGAIVAKFEDNYNKNDFFEVDYSTDLPLEKVGDNEKVYFVDYSFKKNTVWQLEDLVHEKKCDVIWIDHHASSINLQNDSKFAWLKNLKGVRQDKISAAPLTYMYLYGVNFENTPFVLKLVSDYDCWVFDYEPGTVYFKTGLETTDYDALDDVWKDLLFSKNTSNFECVAKLCDLQSKGEVIKSYIDNENKAYRDSYAYETRIEGLRCLAVNRKSNSWIFGEKYAKYPVVMTYAFNGKEWVYSIFSSCKNVDCSKIAEKYGGGGHKGAAGFILNSMPFERCS